MMDCFIYVALSECKTVTKVGSSTNVKSRIGSLKTLNGLGFKCLFHSEALHENYARELERTITNKFKEFLLYGSEWYNIEPITIIEYLIKDVNIKPFEVTDVKNKFPVWDSFSSEHSSAKVNNKYPLMREQTRNGIYYIKYLKGNKLKHIAFCNLGDAIRFYNRNFVFIQIAEVYKEYLYNFYNQMNLEIAYHVGKDIYSAKEVVAKYR